jgi:hypothetical protein
MYSGKISVNSNEHTAGFALHQPLHQAGVPSDSEETIMIISKTSLNTATTIVLKDVIIGLSEFSLTV